jgi:hypothetical protein
VNRARRAPVAFRAKHTPRFTLEEVALRRGQRESTASHARPPILRQHRLASDGSDACSVGARRGRRPGTRGRPGQGPCCAGSRHARPDRNDTRRSDRRGRRGALGGAGAANARVAADGWSRRDVVGTCPARPGDRVAGAAPSAPPWKSSPATSWFPAVPIREESVPVAPSEGGLLRAAPRVPINDPTPQRSSVLSRRAISRAERSDPSRRR